MFIHLKYGSVKEDFVITAFDVLERVRYKYDERSSNLQLVSEHGTFLKHDHVVENARTYRVMQFAR